MAKTVGDSLPGLERFIRLVRNVVLDLRYGAFLGGSVPTRHRSLGAHNVVNSDYGLLPHIFRSVEIRESDVLVDVGCGKGRVINWWLSQGWKNRLIGVELDERIARETKERLRKFGNVEIIHGNILDVLPADGTIFYLFNPFNKGILADFRGLLTSGDFAGARILFYCSRGDSAILDVFRDDPVWTIRDVPLPSSPLYSEARAVLIARAANPPAGTARRIRALKDSKRLEPRPYCRIGL